MRGVTKVGCPFDKLDDRVFMGGYIEVKKRNTLKSTNNDE
jgi:hypothetical protein